MFHMTALTDDRIRDLYATAAGVHNARVGRDGTGDGASGGTNRLRGLRLRLGLILQAAGSALVRGARPATPSRV